MSGERLHDFDLWLGRYVLGTISGYMDRPNFAAHVEKEMDPAILAYFHALDDDDDPPALLLTDEDLRDVVMTVWDAPQESSIPWIASPPLHRRAIECVQEIRTALAPEYAEEWARASAKFAEQLESDKTSLKDGIEIVHEWAREARRLLKAMGATAFLPAPEGAAPTPSCPEPPAPSSSPSEAVASHSARQSDDPLMAAVTEVHDLLLQQRTVKDWYSTVELAQLLGKDPFTVREWCRNGRIKAQKKGSGRGKYKSWVVSRSEVERFQKEGLLPPRR